MHTATQLATSLFEVTVDGAPARWQELLPGWNRLDRLGVVVDRPLGGVGASLLMQLAIAAFYEADEARGGRGYPEAYVFHVGSIQGSYGWYDVFPGRKEVVVPDRAADILDAINDRGITRLAVVDGPSEHVRHHHKEPAAALGRIVSAFAYSARGRVARADVECTALSHGAVENTAITIDPDRTQGLQRRLLAPLPPVPEGEEVVPSADRDVPAEVRAAVGRRRDEISRNGLPTESYRRVPVLDALGMLHVRPDAPLPS